VAVEVLGGEVRRGLVEDHRVLLLQRLHPEHDDVGQPLARVGVDRVLARVAEEHERLAPDLVDPALLLDGDAGQGGREIVDVLDGRPHRFLRRS
jgi:hypothetical protein